MTTSPARAEARIKQLCSLGLASQAVMPALLQELRTVVPCVGATFFWANESGGLANFYDENPGLIEASRVFMQEFYNRRELGIGFQPAMRGLWGVHSCEQAMRMDLKHFARTDQFNLIHRPFGRGNYIWLIVHPPDRPIGLGGPMVHRGLCDRPFAARERRRLADLEPFLAQLLTSSNNNNNSAFPVSNSDKTGLIIATRDGQAVQASPSGRHLLFLATNPSLLLKTNVNWLPNLPPALVRVCRNLAAVFAGDPVADAPTYYHRNVWGGFMFRAHWLEGEANAAGLIGIVVAYREPLLVGIMRGIKSLPLTLRQSQVCRLLANGSSYAEIAKELGISKHTAIARSRWIYDKLDVHNRSELVNRLVSALH